MQPAAQTENVTKDQVNPPKTKNKTRTFIEKTDAKHQHRFRPAVIFLTVAIASVAVFLLEVAILGFP